MTETPNLAGSLADTMIETIRQLTITGTVAVDQPETRRYGSVTFAPQDVTLEFKQSAGKRWLPHKVTVAGPNLKKDGSTGANYHDNSYYFSDYALDWSSMPPPRWALNLVTAHLRELNAGVSGVSADGGEGEKR